MGSADSATVQVEVLGSVRLVVDGRAVEVRGPKRRAVLALLALAEGRAVTVDTLVDALWPAEVPDSGRAALHSHVSRLRRDFGPAQSRLETLDAGYRLRLDTGGLDWVRVRSLLAQARADAPRDPGAAAALLREAEALWRGPALGEFAEVAPLAASAVALEQLHAAVLDLLVECAIDAGEAADVVGLATQMLAADPLREPAVRLLMRALAATGRPVDALGQGWGYRRRLSDEAGLDPSAALGELERDIASGAVGSMPATGDRPARGKPTLARPATRLIGRDADITAVQQLMTTERLITLVGPGGVGKSRMALEVARQAEDATMLLLAPVTDRTALPHALAAALNLRVTQGDVLATCVAMLSAGPRLLVVDNCEHLLDAVRDMLDAILHGCPELSVLTTSRVPLGLPAECPYRLAPLPLAEPDQIGPDIDARGLAVVPSIAVFLDRAARVRPGFAPDHDELRVIADVVRRLDGMPLAIELAAGRLSTFSLADLSQRLDRALDLLAGGRPAGESRHRTLRATVEWSYQLLSEDEQRLFRHLSVFADGVDLTTAEQVATDLGQTRDPGSAVAHLVDASMIQVAFEGRTRYRMLETLRAFGLDRLRATGEEDAAANRLLRWAVELTAWIDATILTEREPLADAVLRRELPNLRVAWRLARDRGSFDEAAALVTALHEASLWRDLAEIWGWAGELLDDAAMATHPGAAAVLSTAADNAYMRGDYPQAERLARAGLQRAVDAEGRWCCLRSLAIAAFSRGAYGEVVEHYSAAAELATRPTADYGMAALGATYGGDLALARTLNARLQAHAVSPGPRAIGAYVDGEIENSAGRPERAEQHYTTAIDLAGTAGATFVAGVAPVGLLTALAAADRRHDALRGYRELVDYWARAGNWTHQWVTLRNLAQLLRRLGDDEAADLLEAAADQAPDAPVVSPPQGSSRLSPQVPASSHERVLELARQAIDRNLHRP